MYCVVAMMLFGSDEMGGVVAVILIEWVEVDMCAVVAMILIGWLLDMCCLVLLQ